jgi:hypothetical protein
MKKGETNKYLDNAYSFLSLVYHGNWQDRWSNTPYLEDALKKGRNESINAHSWASMEFWFLLRRACPRLDSLVDTTEVYEILLNHDLGETFEGDFPLYERVSGKRGDRSVEITSLKSLVGVLGKLASKVIGWVSEFDGDIEKIESLEVVVAKWIGILQGNHFALTFGNDLQDHSEKINKVLQLRFIPYTNKLIEILKKKRHTKAVEEVREIANNHIESIKDAGIEFDSSKLNL